MPTGGQVKRLNNCQHAGPSGAMSALCTPSHRESIIVLIGIASPAAHLRAHIGMVQLLPRVRSPADAVNSDPLAGIAVTALHTAVDSDTIDNAVTSLVGLIGSIELSRSGKDKSLSSKEWMFGKDEDENDAVAKIVGTSRSVIQKYGTELQVLMHLGSAVLRLAAINDISSEPMLQVIVGDLMEASPAAAMASLEESLPNLLKVVQMDTELESLLAIMSRYAMHPYYGSEACDLLRGHIPRLLEYWVALSDLTPAPLFRLLSLLVKDAQSASSFLDVSPNGATYVSQLVDIVIDKSSGQVRAVDSLNARELDDLFEALHLIGVVSLRSPAAAAAFATASIDHELFVSDLVRGLRHLTNRAACAADTALVARRTRVCRQIEVLSGIVASLPSVKSLPDEKARLRVERHVIEVAADNFDVFARSACALLETFDTKRADNPAAMADAAWSGRLCLVEVVKQIPRMIVQYEHRYEGRLVVAGDDVDALVVVIRLIVRYATAATPPAFVNYERVMRVVTKRLLEIVAAVQHWAIRSEALRAVAVLGAAMQPAQLTSLIVTAPTIMRHHVHDAASVLVYVAFRVIAGALNADHADLDLGALVNGTLALLESCADASERAGDPLIDNPDSIARLRQSCVKLLHLAWRNVALWRAVHATPSSRARVLLGKTLAGEFVTALAPGDAPAAPVAIEQTPLAFNAAVVLGALDDLAEMAEATASQVAETGEDVHRVRAQMQRVVFRCLQQVADTVAGDRRDDVVARLVEASADVATWTAAPSGRVLAECVARESGLWRPAPTARLRLVPLQVAHADLMHRLETGIASGSVSGPAPVEHWRAVATCEVGARVERHFVVLARGGIVGFAGVAADDADPNTAVIHTLVVGDMLDAQDAYDARLELIAHVTRWAGLHQRSRLTLTVADGSAHGAWLEKHDNVFRIAAHHAPGRVTFEWHAQLDVPLEERIDHDGTTVQGQIRALLMRRQRSQAAASTPDLLSGLARIHALVVAMAPADSGVDLGRARSMRPRIEAYTREAYEKTMREHAVADGEPSPPLPPPASCPTPETRSAHFMRDLEAAFSDGPDPPVPDVWTPPAIGTGEENLLGFATELLASTTFCDLQVEPNRGADHSTRHRPPGRHQQWQAQVTVVDGTRCVDVAGLTLSAYLRLISALLTSSSATMASRRKATRQVLRPSWLSAVLGAVFHKDGPGDALYLGAKLCSVLSASLTGGVPAWAVEPFIESCDDVILAVDAVAQLMARVTRVIRSRSSTERRLAPGLEATMACAAGAFDDAISAVRKLHYLARLNDAAAGASVLREGTGAYAARLAERNADLQEFVIADLLPLAHVHAMLDYDLEMAAGTYTAGTGDVVLREIRPGCGTLIDTMRARLCNVLAEAGDALTKDYVRLAVVQGVSLRPSYLADVLGRASLAASARALQQRMLDAQVFAVDEFLEAAATIEVRAPARSVLFGAGIVPRVLILSCHYAYIGAAITDAPSSFQRLHYGDIYEAELDATGQEITVGYVEGGCDGDARITRQTWVLRAFGAADSVAAVLTRKCRLFCSAWWQVRQAPVPGAVVRLCTLVDVLRDNGTLERRSLVWACKPHEQKLFEFVYAAKESPVPVEAPDIPSAQLQALSTSGWAAGADALGGYLALSKIDSVEVAETPRAILVLGVGQHKLSVFFVCDSARQMWHRALQSSLKSGRKPAAWDVVMIPSRDL